MTQLPDAPAHQEIFLPAASDMPAGNSLVRWLWFFLRPYSKTWLCFALFRLMRFLLIAILPLAIGKAIDAFNAGWAYDDPARLFIPLCLYLACYGLSLVSIYFLIWEGSAEDRMIRGMTLFSVRHINSLPLSWHEKEGSGGKMQRVMTARNAVKQFWYIYKWYAVPFISSMIGIVLSIQALGAPGFFFLMFAGFVVTYIVVGTVMARPLPALHDHHNRILEKLMAGVYEFVSAVRTVKAFHMESYIGRQAQHYEMEGHYAWRNILRAMYGKWSLLNLSGFLWIAAFALVGLYGIYQGTLTTGGFATLFFLAQGLWTRLEDIIYVQDQFIEARNGFGRLIETLAQDVPALDLDPPLALPADWRRIRFEKTGFSYQGEGSQPALHDIDLTLERGEKIALVGRSGAGKSTLVKLVMKQVLPTGGRILIEDADLSRVKSADWLSRIGFVPQDIELFNLSIRDNILLDRADETNEETYRQAIRQAALEELIDSLPEGDATLIGERGIKLSGGQRQRLGIARALVRSADLIIFDEATSALDSLSEKTIQQAIETGFDGKSIIIIAHRLSTVRFADRIIVLEDGRIVEQGSFAALLAARGKFAAMWDLQSAGLQKSSGTEPAEDL